MYIYIYIYIILENPIGMDDLGVLGGELPTNRLGGLVHPSFLSGRLAPIYPIYNQDCHPLTKWDEPPSTPILGKYGILDNIPVII